MTCALGGAQKSRTANRRSSGLVTEQKTALTAALTPLIRPNVVLDQTATAAARETEANQIQPVVISLKRNQVVAREGDTVTPSILAQIAAIKSAGHAGRPWHNFFGLLLRRDRSLLGGLEVCGAQEQWQRAEFE